MVTTTTEFINAILPNVEVSYDFDEFWCDIDENIINVGMDTDTYGDRLIQQFIFEKFGVKMNPFLIGVLHEIGHFMTYDEELDKDRSILYYMIQINYTVAQLKEYSYMYFSIPAEFEATKWAVNYYLSHKEYCDNFIKEIGL